MSFLAELKRRNVIRVGIAYVVVAWLVMQVADVVLNNIEAPGWVFQVILLLLGIGLPLVLLFAWVFEMTPEGLKLEKDVDRSQSMTQVTGQKLNSLIIGLLVLALAYFVVDKFVLDPGRDAALVDAALQSAAESQPPGPEPGAEPERSIAVLPFVNMSSDPEQDYFSDGITEELLNLLAKIPGLQVAARTSSFSFKGQNLEIPVIAERLGVAHVLEGSVRKAGDQVRITAQLIHADDGFHLWSETYDRKLENIFAIQDEISAAVVDALRVTLLGETPRSRETDPEAYRLYLEGQYFFNQRSENSIIRAVDLLEQAVAIDPSYAPAWAELSYARMWVGAVGIREPDEIMPLASDATDRALELDPNLSLAHITRAIHSVFYEFEFERGLAEYRRAWESDPGSALGNGGYGIGLRTLGRMGQAIEYQQLSLQRDPLSPEAHVNLGRSLEIVQRFDEAEAYFRKALELSPDFAGGHHRLARVKLLRGDYPAALDEALAEIDHEVYGPTSLAMAYFSLGDLEASDRELARLIEIGGDTGAYQVAEVYAWRGQTDEAFQWLEKCRLNGDSGLASLLGDRFFAALWTDPRWEALLRKLGLWEAWQAMPPEWGGPQT